VTIQDHRDRLEHMLPEFARIARASFALGAHLDNSEVQCQVRTTEQANIEVRITYRSMNVDGWVPLDFAVDPQTGDVTDPESPEEQG
jgi:hypothetical protein